MSVRIAILLSEVNHLHLIGMIGLNHERGNRSNVIGAPKAMERLPFQGAKISFFEDHAQ
jgi:hypothetical protein